MKSFAAILKYTNPILVGRKVGKSNVRTANTIKLANANKQLLIQNQDKKARAAELLIANKELLFQNLEKNKRAIELTIANKELALQKIEKSKRAIELTFVSKELKKAEKNQHDYAEGLKEIMFIISHDVRLPLANIIGISELLNQTDNTPEEINQCVDYLKQSALLLETSTKKLAFYIAYLEDRNKTIQWQ
jgi:signal transduction histidine kinase